MDASIAQMMQLYATNMKFLNLTGIMELYTVIIVYQNQIYVPVILINVIQKYIFHLLEQTVKAIL